MKIAVLFSGLIPDKVPVEENVKSVYAAFPTADFYFGSWDIPENENISFLDVKFKELKHHYNCYTPFIKNQISNIREMIKNNETPSEVQLSALKFSYRSKLRQNINQVLIHTMMYQQFVEHSDYDIVVRARYETYIDPLHVDKFEYFVNLCYENDKPIGFETIDDDYKLMALGWNKFAQETPNGISSFSDWLIIHRKDKFYPDTVWQMYYQKKIRYAESAWYDILFIPNKFNVENTCWNGYVTLKRV